MIDFEKVSFTHTKDEGAMVRTIEADIKLHAEAKVHDEELLAIKHPYGPKGVLTQAKNHLLNQLWHEAYGDLNEPLHRLYAVALRGCRMPKDVQEIREHMATLTVLLKRPPRFTI